MTAVSEWVVREYFEAQGFFVRQPRKYAVSARHKRQDEEVDLLVVRPRAKEQSFSSKPLWGASALRRVARAVVSVRGWHTERFSRALLDLSPEVFRFTEPEVLQQAAESLGEGPVARILCIPELPASSEGRREALHMLRERGVDGVLLFRTMLLDLSERVQPSKSYEKSDLLQVLRLLKNYNLLRDAQLDLFQNRGRRKRRAAGSAKGTGP